MSELKEILKIAISIVLIMSFSSIKSKEISNSLIWKKCNEDSIFTLNSKYIISQDSKILFSLSKNGTIYKLDLMNGKLIEKFNFEENTLELQKYHYLLSPDNKYLFGASSQNDHGIFVINLESKKIKNIFKNNAKVTGLTIDTLNKRLYIGLNSSSFSNGNVWIYEYETDNEAKLMFSNVGVLDLTYDHKRNKLYSLLSEEIYDPTLTNSKDTLFKVNKMEIFDLSTNVHEKPIQITNSKNPFKKISILEISPDCGYLNILFGENKLFDLDNFKLSNINIKNKGKDKFNKFLNNDQTMISIKKSQSQLNNDTLILFNPINSEIKRIKTIKPLINTIYNSTSPILIFVYPNQSKSGKFNVCFEAINIEKLLDVKVK